MSEEKQEKTPRVRVKTTNRQRMEAVTLYRAGDHTVEEISKLVGVPEGNLRKYFSRQKVYKGEIKQLLEEKRRAAMEQAFVMDPVVHARRIFETKNDTYRIAEMLRKLVGSKIAEEHKKGGNLGVLAQEMKAIREAAAALKTCREEAYAVLGIKEGDLETDNLPELTIKGLDEEQILDLQSNSIATGIGDVPDAPTDD